MRRRDFLAMTGAAGAAALASRVAFGQQAALGMKRLGFLFDRAEDDPASASYVDALRQGLSMQGWVEGKNLIIDRRYGTALAAAAQKSAQELITLAPDVLVSLSGPASAAALASETRTIPIVFAQLPEFVGAPMVGNLTRPAGNVTGFLNVDDPTISGKWVDLLKELSPGLKRIGFLLNAANLTQLVLLPSFDAAGHANAVLPLHMGFTAGGGIAISLSDFALEPGSGVVIPNDTVLLLPNRKVMYTLTAALRLPAVWGDMVYAIDGAPVVYALDTVKQVVAAGAYAGRVLNGEKIADLPGQRWSTYSLIVNLKSASAQGLAIPPSLVAKADQVTQ